MKTLFDAVYGGQNVSALMSALKKCYEEHHSPPPPSVKLFEAVYYSGSSKDEKLTFNKAMLGTVQDIVVAMHDREECNICKDSTNSTSANSTSVNF